MKPKISLVTLGVADLERAVRFYRDGMGLPLHESSSEDIAFFALEGTWLSLFPRERLAEDAQLEDTGAPGAFPGFTLAHNVPSKEAVHEVMDAAAAAGAEVVKAPEEVFWGGYSGYFRAPDGFLWEIAFNPFMDLT